MVLFRGIKLSNLWYRQPFSPSESGGCRSVLQLHTGISDSCGAWGFAEACMAKDGETCGCRRSAGELASMPLPAALRDASVRCFRSERKLKVLPVTEHITLPCAPRLTDSSVTAAAGTESNPGGTTSRWQCASRRASSSEDSAVAAGVAAARRRRAGVDANTAAPSNGIGHAASSSPASCMLVAWGSKVQG